MRGNRDTGKTPSAAMESHLLAFTILGLMVALLLSVPARIWLPGWYAPIMHTAAGFLVWMTALGTARAAATGRHVRLAFPAAFASPATRRRLSLFADAMFLLFAASVLVIGCGMVRYSLTDPSPRGHIIVYLALPVGMTLTILRLLRRIRRGWRAKE